MKLTESTLRRIIKEELNKVLNQDEKEKEKNEEKRNFIYNLLDNTDKIGSWKYIRQSFVDATNPNGKTKNISYPNWQPQDFQDVIDVLDNKPENKEKIKGIYKRLDMTPL